MHEWFHCKIYFDVDKTTTPFSQVFHWVEFLSRGKCLRYLCRWSGIWILLNLFGKTILVQNIQHSLFHLSSAWNTHTQLTYSQPFRLKLRKQIGHLMRDWKKNTFGARLLTLKWWETIPKNKVQLVITLLKCIHVWVQCSCSG